MPSINKPTKAEEKIFVHNIASVLVIFFIIASIGAGWSYLKLQAAKARFNKPIIAEQIKHNIEPVVNPDDFVIQVKKHVIVPDNEKPFVAFISDEQVAANLQPFFYQAKVGDVILMYSNKAILYRPVEDKIVNIGPVFALSNFDFDKNLINANDAESAVEQKVITVDVRNGSQTAGQARTVADELSKSKWYDLIKVTNASNYNYPQTLLVNLTGVDVSELEDLYGITALVDLPAGETISEADVVIILGNDL